jgi:hypothetical protein
VHRAFELLRTARFAPALPSALAVAQIRSQSGLNFAKARARCGFARGHLLDIVIYVPGGSGGGHEIEAAEALVRLLVGEELFERWVGTVSATPTVRGGPLVVLNPSVEEHAALPLETLPETVRAAITGLKLGLPPLPLPHAAGEDWIAFELEPESATDYAAQDDLVMCSTRTPELKKSFLHGEPFFSGRFTNSNALFTYLKFETRKSTAREQLAERAAFEAVVQGTLLPSDGVVLGLGLGRRYSYIDLALGDPDCARERLLPALRAAELPRRAWLLFCDSELEREYLPIHAESGEPYWRS